MTAFFVKLALGGLDWLKALRDALKRFFGALNAQGWIGLIVAAALTFALLHEWGEARHWQKQSGQWEKLYKRRGADEAKAQAEATARAQAINTKLRKANDEENRHIVADADDLRLRGPGRARVAAPPSAPSGHVAPGGVADAPVDQVPDGERVDLIAMPFASAVAFAEQCDANRAEVLKWRESDALQSQQAQPQEKTDHGP